LSRKTILIVEDEADIRESLREAFENRGYSVRCASNGMEALELLLRHPPPSAVVLDLIMPVMSGSELYAAMQADPVLSNIPVIVSTSDPSRAPQNAVVLKKPIDLRVMLMMVDAVSVS